MVKGHQHWIFLDNRPLASERVPGFTLRFCPGPLVRRGRGVGQTRLWFQVQLEAKVLSSAHAPGAWLAVLVCYLWKATQYLIKQYWTILSWFCLCNSTYSIMNSEISLSPHKLQIQQTRIFVSTPCWQCSRSYQVCELILPAPWPHTFQTLHPLHDP